MVKNEKHPDMKRDMKTFPVKLLISEKACF